MGFPENNELHDAPELIIAEWQLSDPYGVRDTATYSNAEITANPVLYLCNQPDPGKSTFSAFGQNYQPLIKSHGTRPAKASYGDSTASGDAVLVLHNAPYVWQRRLAYGYPNRETGEPDVKLQQLFSQFLPGVLTVWSVVAPYSGASPQLQQIFKGNVYRPQFTRTEVTVPLVQSKAFDTVFPSKGKPTGGGGPSIVDRISYPDAPSNSIGQSIPLVCCGDVRQDYNSLSSAELLSINPQLLQGLAPMVMTKAKYDAGGSSVGTVVANKYPALGTPTVGLDLICFNVPELNTLAVMDGSAPVVDSHEASYVLGLNEYAHIYLNPIAHVSAVSVSNPERAWDGKWDTYARIQGATGELRLKVPNLSYLGAISSIYAFAFTGTSGTTPRGTGVDTGAGAASVNGVIGVWEETQNAWYGASNRNITKGDIETSYRTQLSAAVDYAGLTAPNVNQWSWEYIRGAATDALSFKITSTVAAVDIHVYACGFLVSFIPQNIWREKHVKELIPTIGVDGRVKRWEYK
jgi:hypothetical protein